MNGIDRRPLYKDYLNRAEWDVEVQGGRGLMIGVVVPLRGG